jgi:hypothetical protein
MLTRSRYGRSMDIVPLWRGWPRDRIERFLTAVQKIGDVTPDVMIVVETDPDALVRYRLSNWAAIQIHPAKWREMGYRVEEKRDLASGETIIRVFEQ